ncbi:phage tail sheath subtilisin-like domain-containing protein [Rhodovulum sp. MB263]|uniref:phage tail sheath family protein n=1 Tax=Rhodovulum sp. (strain MB263) TaxID=308754 RepID=UPI001E2C8E24|nr:phage tail sheath subtilisin-like domain-containing protein [Rhodovulum sp. MB263]
MVMTVAAPGVYVFEEKLGPRTIEAVGTSVAALVGRVPLRGVAAGTPVPVNGWMEFRRRFTDEDSSSTDLSNAAFGAFANGLRRLWVMPTEAGSEISDDDLRPLEGIDEIAIVAAPGYATKASHDALATHAMRCSDRFALFDLPKDAPVEAMTEVGGATRRGGAATDGGGDGPAPAPSSAPSSATAKAVRPSSIDCGACYAPWLLMQDPLKPGERVLAPPSGHVAGIYARVDATRGVHKAPANELVLAAIDAERRITRQQQELLNPRGVNAIRFMGGGLKVWGARTLSEDSLNRYVPVVRLVLMIRESIEQGTGWVVFEPNSYPLWEAIKLDVRAFMTRLWRSGALVGRTPDEAFFVKCDEETNPPEIRDAGRVETLIGFAPVRPAEFVIFRLAQVTAGAEPA